MKVAVVYNSPDDRVLQHRGIRAHEVYSRHNVERISNALRANGHQVIELKADRYLIDELERFFGPVTDDAWPGLVFNIAFGTQGQLRYCHLPSLLEMLGLPYLGSGPLGHALATDKAAAKAIFLHYGLSTPDFWLIESVDFAAPDVVYPVVVKPVAEASSLGVRLVGDEAGLREAVRDNLAAFGPPVMIERFVDGREINVSIIGNASPTALPLVEVVLGEGGVPIYTREDKSGHGTRGFELCCPADLPEGLAKEVESAALRAFSALDCRDWARVEMRLDEDGTVQLLEINTIPGLGAIASFPAAARAAGMEDFPALVQRLVETAALRYGYIGE